MGRKLGAHIIAIALVGLGAGPAYADHDDRDRDSRNRKCNDAGDYCSDDDFSPTFDKSPVQDSFIFSPTICLPGSTCEIHNDKGGDAQQPAS